MFLIIYFGIYCAGEANKSLELAKFSLFFYLISTENSFSATELCALDKKVWDRNVFGSFEKHTSLGPPTKAADGKLTINYNGGHNQGIGDRNCYPIQLWG